MKNLKRSLSKYLKRHWRDASVMQSMVEYLNKHYEEKDAIEIALGIIRGEESRLKEKDLFSVEMMRSFFESDRFKKASKEVKDTFASELSSLLDKLDRISKPEREKVKRPPIELTHETVIGAADEIMREGRGVTASLILNKLNIPGSRRDEVLSFLDKAVEDGKYEKRKIDFRKYKYYIYSPKGHRLPYVPKGVKSEMMARLMKDVDLYIAKKDEFEYKDIALEFKNYRSEFGISAGILRSCITLALIFCEEDGKLERKIIDNRTVYRRVRSSEEIFEEIYPPSGKL